MYFIRTWLIPFASAGALLLLMPLGILLGVALFPLALPVLAVMGKLAQRDLSNGDVYYITPQKKKAA